MPSPLEAQQLRQGSGAAAKDAVRGEAFGASLSKPPGSTPGAAAGSPARLSSGVLAVLMQLHEPEETRSSPSAEDDEPVEDEGADEGSRREHDGGEEKSAKQGDSSPEDREPGATAMSEAQQRAALFLQQAG